MSKTLGLKIAGSALLIPALTATFMLTLCGGEKNPKTPKPRDPQVTAEKALDIRKYKTGGNISNVYIFTSPGNPDEHCVVTDRESSVFNCYPNVPGLKPATEGILDVKYYKEPTIGNIIKFDDPENPALYCIGNNSNGSLTCRLKPQPAALPAIKAPK